MLLQIANFSFNIMIVKVAIIYYRKMRYLGSKCEHLPFCSIFFQEIARILSLKRSTDSSYTIIFSEIETYFDTLAWYYIRRLLIYISFILNFRRDRKS